MRAKRRQRKRLDRVAARSDRQMRAVLDRRYPVEYDRAEGWAVQAGMDEESERLPAEGDGEVAQPVG